MCTTVQQWTDAALVFSLACIAITYLSIAMVWMVRMYYMRDEVRHKIKAEMLQYIMAEHINRAAFHTGSRVLTMPGRKDGA